MRRWLRTSVLALILAACVIACDSGGEETSGESGASSTGSTKRNVDIESSLEDSHLLPPHVRWTATTSLPTEDIRSVRFIVDKRPIWTDFDAPYSYGEEGAYLATRTFSDHGNDERRHRFTVRVVTKSGEKWSETVEADVPEEDIDRSWHPLDYTIWERIAPGGVKKPVEKYYPFISKTGHIHFVGASLHIGRSLDRAFAYEIVSMDRNSLELGVPIFLGSREAGGQVGGFHFKGFQCAADGPTATYSWSAGRGPFMGRYTASFVQVRAVNDPCEQRRHLLEGVWLPAD